MNYGYGKPRPPDRLVTLAIALFLLLIAVFISSVAQLNIQRLKDILWEDHG